MTGDCELCDVGERVHTLPMAGTLDDLGICDDCAVGRREQIVENGELD